MTQRIRAPGSVGRYPGVFAHRARHFPVRLFLIAVWLVTLLATLIPASLSSAQSSGGEVYVISISGTIDLGLAPYLERVLEEAEDANAANSRRTIEL